jgi:NADH:ubiquinone oxidoreductase subunit K
MLVNEFLLLAAALFCIGVYGVIARKNGVMVLMSIELILNSVNINILAFAVQNGHLVDGKMFGDPNGHVFALFIIAVAAAEVAVGLAIVLLIYRNRRSIALDELSEMKG